jgi:protein O-mannosyl-transferase
MADRSLTMPVTVPDAPFGVTWRQELSAGQILRASFLIVVGFLPYLNTLWNGLVYDDQYQIIQNPFLRSFHFVGVIFKTSVWAFQVKHATVTYYRPLMSFSYLLIYQAFGPVSYAFHLQNVVLHCGVVILLYLIARRVSGSESIALIAAAWFALHPIHTEVVAWVAAVPDLQMTFFVLLAFWFYLKATSQTRRVLPYLLGTYVSFALALLSKEPALMFPAVLLFYDVLRFFPGEKSTLKRCLVYQLPVWLTAAVYVYGRFFLLSGIVPNNIRSTMTLREVLFSAASLFGAYMQKLVWPGTAGAAYRFQATSSALDPRFILGALALSVVGVALLLTFRAKSRIVLAIAWTTVFLLPVLDAKVMASNVFAERYLYLPSVGFCCAAAVLVHAAWSYAAERKYLAIRVGMILGIGAASVTATYAIVKRNAVWHDEERLFRAMLAQDPKNATALSDLGAMYWNSQRKSLARETWFAALHEDPKNFFVLDNLGISAAQEKNYTEAIGYFRSAVAIRPGFPRVHMHLAQALENLGDFASAQIEYEKTLDLAPFDVEARNVYAKFCMGQGRVADAEREYRLSLNVAPSSDALAALGMMAIGSRNATTADQLFKQATELDPFDSRAHFGLARAFELEGRSAEAIHEYERGLETDPSNPEAHAALSKLRATVK